ncbi:site-2 protease family protein [Streptomyces sp. TRM68416]|uniref:site-2 protease family protein n=1 Tax=Streptomyces sp. TRM68416 TaxID=2758412 RepID=UPI0016620764|nr:site-2 protease family protein [Streptomyces sp. TRM68416]MBD0841436.1 site-2 protease family protein [Streptomyces sp. TRM68416]
MNATFSLGRIVGIRVGAHWSVLAVLLILTAGLAEGRLPSAHSGHSVWTYWAVGLATAAVFLASLLAHEISHAVVARRNGVTVEGITLWLLGGVARLRSEAPSPGAELRIAGVGPLVSLVLGVLFGAAAGVLGGLRGAGLGVEALAWLAGINILLALFNALPAAPLDGGRLLRAVVWHRTGDALRATLTATAAGRVLGWLLIGAGLYLLFLGASFSGIWLAVIGWFLIATATVEGGQARMRELLSGVPVRDVMTPDPHAVPAGASIAGFLGDPALRYRHSAFPVLGDDGRPVGLITVHRAGQVPPGDRDTTELGSVMVPITELPTAGPSDPLAGLLPRLEGSPLRRALVLSDDGALAGIVTSSDISRLTTWLTSTAVWRGSTASWHETAGRRTDDQR